MNNSSKKLGYILLHIISILFFVFTVLYLISKKEIIPAIILAVSVAIISRSQYLISLYVPRPVLRIEPDTVYTYYGTTNNGNLLLSKQKKDGTYEDGIYSSKEIEWFEDPILYATYIYKESSNRYFMYLYIQEKIEQEEK